MASCVSVGTGDSQPTTGKKKKVKKGTCIHGTYRYKSRYFGLSAKKEQTGAPTHSYRYSLTLTPHTHTHTHTNIHSTPLLASDKHPGPRRFRRPAWVHLVPFRSAVGDLGTSGLLQTVGSGRIQTSASSLWEGQKKNPGTWDLGPCLVRSPVLSIPSALP
ncbi:hypothetical protein CGRA01v4_04747 [Colletotrichum graminicola]|nr:hypothetical protein CGRA01v4_04747 [Colletotrichum graminicola]